MDSDGFLFSDGVVPAMQGGGDLHSLHGLLRGPAVPARCYDGRRLPGELQDDVGNHEGSAEAADRGGDRCTGEIGSYESSTKRKLAKLTERNACEC